MTCFRNKLVATATILKAGLAEWDPKELVFCS